MNMDKRIVAPVSVAGVAAAVLAGTLFIGRAAGSATPAATPSFPTGTPAAKSIITNDRLQVSSLRDLAGYSQTVIRGKFEQVVAEGLGSQYRMGSSGTYDPAVQVWRVSVLKYLKGDGANEVYVVRYNPAYVQSDDSPVDSGDQVILFLAPVGNGANVVIGGDQGLIEIGADGTTKTVGGMPVPGAGGKSPEDLAAAMG